MSEPPSKRRRIDSGVPHTVAITSSFHKLFLGIIPFPILNSLGLDFQMSWAEDPNSGYRFVGHTLRKLVPWAFEPELIPEDVVRSVVKAPSAFFAMLERSLKKSLPQFAQSDRRAFVVMSRLTREGGMRRVKNYRREMRDLFLRTVQEESAAMESLETEEHSSRLAVVKSLSFGRVVSLLIEKFRFGRLPDVSSWLKSVDVRILREEEQKVLVSHRPGTSWTQVSLFQTTSRALFLPMDVFVEILSFLKHDYSLMCSVGLVSEEFFVGLLLSWETIIVSPSNLREISLLAFRSVSRIEVVSPFDLTQRKTHLMRQDWDYFWNGIQPRRIRVLDLADIGHIPKGFTQFLCSFEGLHDSERPIFSGCRRFAFPRIEDIRHRDSLSLFRRCSKSIDLLAPAFPNVTSIENVNGPLGSLVRGCDTIRNAHILDFEKIGGLTGKGATSIKAANAGLEGIPWLTSLKLCHVTIVWWPCDEMMLVLLRMQTDNLLFRVGFASVVSKMTSVEEMKLTQTLWSLCDHSWRYRFHPKDDISVLGFCAPPAVRRLTCDHVWEDGARIQIDGTNLLSLVSLRLRFESRVSLSRLSPAFGLLISPSASLEILIRDRSLLRLFNQLPAFVGPVVGSGGMNSCRGGLQLTLIRPWIENYGDGGVHIKWDSLSCQLHVFSSNDTQLPGDGNAYCVPIWELLRLFPKGVLGRWHGKIVPVSVVFYYVGFSCHLKVSKRWRSVVDSWELPNVSLEKKSVEEWRWK